jgi:hypothetical protein
MDISSERSRYLPSPRESGVRPGTPWSRTSLRSSSGGRSFRASWRSAFSCLASVNRHVVRALRGRIRFVENNSGASRPRIGGGCRRCGVHACQIQRGVGFFNLMSSIAMLAASGVAGWPSRASLTGVRTLRPPGLGHRCRSPRTTGSWEAPASSSHRRIPPRRIRRRPPVEARGY